MKLTTKRNRLYFWRELFSYMIPMILIVGTVDVFYHFMQCPLHPEWSAPCSINWILAAIYGSFLIITIFFSIVTTKMLRKIKKQIENEFLEIANQRESKHENKLEGLEKIEEKSEEIEKVKIVKPKKIIVKSDKKEPTKKIVKKEAKEGTKKSTRGSTKKELTKKKASSKK